MISWEWGRLFRKETSCAKSSGAKEHGAHPSSGVEEEKFAEVEVIGGARPWKVLMGHWIFLVYPKAVVSHWRVSSKKRDVLKSHTVFVCFLSTWPYRKRTGEGSLQKVHQRIMDAGTLTKQRGDEYQIRTVVGTCGEDSRSHARIFGNKTLWQNMKVGRVRLTSRLLTLKTTGERVVPFWTGAPWGEGAHYEVPGRHQMETSSR